MAYRNFKQQFTFQKRLEESSRVLYKYPDKIPVICEKYIEQVDLPDMPNKKFLVPFYLTVGQFICIIRNKIKLKPNESIYLFINDRIITGTDMFSNIYDRYKNHDGFLYIQYTKENTFG